MFKIVKSNDTARLIGGVVLEPGAEVEGHNLSVAEVEAAMYKFMIKYAEDPQRVSVNLKGKKHFLPIIETFIPEQDTVKGGQPLRKGAWWLSVAITDDEVWQQVEQGKLSFVSLGIVPVSKSFSIQKNRRDKMKNFKEVLEQVSEFLGEDIEKAARPSGARVEAALEVLVEQKDGLEDEVKSALDVILKWAVAKESQRVAKSSDEWPSFYLAMPAHLIEKMEEDEDED